VHIHGREARSKQHRHHAHGAAANPFIREPPGRKPRRVPTDRLFHSSLEIEISVFGSDEQIAFRCPEEVGCCRAAGVTGERTSVDRASVNKDHFAVFLAHVFEQIGIHTVQEEVDISIAVPVRGVKFLSTAASSISTVQAKRLAFNVDENMLARRVGRSLRGR